MHMPTSQARRLRSVVQKIRSVLLFENGKEARETGKESERFILTHEVTLRWLSNRYAML
jgi:hypothetical protein